MPKWYESRPKRYVGCFLTRMLNWMWIFYNELRSVLLVGEIERVRWKVTNDKELQITDQVESFDYFLNEGEKYLSMAYDLRDFNEKSSKLLPRVLKALDAYTRLNAFCKSTKLWDVMESYEYYYEKSIENGHKKGIKQNKERKIAERMYDVQACEAYYDILFMFREKEEKDSDQLDDSYADSLLAKDHHVFLFLRQLMSINMLVAQLQDLYTMFNRHRLSLYILLADYCLKADSFLHRNVQFRSSRKLRCGKKRSMRCKYRRLEQLIARIIEERKYMAKYIETASDYRRTEASAK